GPAGGGIGAGSGDAVAPRPADQHGQQVQQPGRVSANPGMGPGKDRRVGKPGGSGEDRRAVGDRRNFNDPNYKGLERRSGQDRRSVKERRKSP
ncbi:MAG: hypothetical protein MUP41_10685, partial [Desulfobacterales bacterium]|nr:hypothetical protein [Desulfobacterales bacterium]